MHYLLAPSVLTKVILGCALISICAFMIGPPGRGIGAGAGGGAIAPVICNNRSVFKAAPVKTIGTPVGTFVSEKLKAPPPYVNTRTVTVHRSQEKPSSCCTA